MYLWVGKKTSDREIKLAFKSAQVVKTLRCYIFPYNWEQLFLWVGLKTSDLEIKLAYKSIHVSGGC